MRFCRILFPIIWVSMLLAGCDRENSTSVLSPASKPSTSLLPHGVDSIRGAWGGTLTGLAPWNLQLNLYFNELTPDPNEPNNSAIAVAAGFISLSEPQKKKRADAPLFPMSARFEDAGNSQLSVSLLGNIVNPSGEVEIIKLTGTIELHGSSTVDDFILQGVWHLQGKNGTWEAHHLDRRRVNAPAIDLDDPTIDFFFEVDAYCAKQVGEETSKVLLLEVYTNVVSTSVLVDLSEGGSVIVSPSTDVFSPNVDFVTLFRFVESFLKEPEAGGTYTFRALDATGQPIPGVTDIDVYIGGNEPEAPSSVMASFSPNEGIQVTWDPVMLIPGAFEPASGIGFYQIELSGLFGANDIASSPFLIPWNDLGANMFGIPLMDFPDGTYGFDVIAFSVAPEGSEGHGLECQTRDGREGVHFEKNGTAIIIEP